MSGSLGPHELHHTRLPCPSVSPEVCSNSCPLSQWCHPTSITLFSFCPQSFPASESLPISMLFTPCGQSTGASTSALDLPMSIQGLFPSFKWAEAPILWPPDAKSRFIRKDPDAGKDWRQEERGMTEDEMLGWYHWLNGPKFEHAPGDGEGQGSLACCSPWGRKESDTTERLNNN